MAEGHLHIGVHPEWHWGNLTFHADTLISMWTVSIILLILAIWINRRLERNPEKPPSTIHHAAEIVIEGLGSLPAGRMGERGLKYLPFVGTIFIYILFANWFGLIPLTALYQIFFERWFGAIPEFIPPAADLNTTAGLALIAFLGAHLYGMREKGWRYFKHFLEPSPLFLPLNIMEELSKPLSLALRLFGNIFGKETIIIILTSLLAFPIIYPVPLMVLSFLIGAIQAYIFALLTTFYIAAATAEEH